MSSLGQDMRYEFQRPANKPASRASGVCWLWQNLIESVLLGIIGGTIGRPVAYSLLRRVDSIAPMGILPLQETGVDLKLVVRQETAVGIQAAESRAGMARQTYRGLLRQIRSESRVPISLILSTGGNGCSPQPQSRYWYSISKRIAMSIKELEARLRQIRSGTMRASA